MPPSNIIHVGEGFWNIRGSLKIGGILDVKTHASLVRRKGGGYILLDAYELDEATRSWIAEETSGGDAIEAVLHLHPFHTLFVRALHEAYPKAKLYDYVTPAYVNEVLDQHCSGKANRRLLIWSFLSFEWWLRNFVA